MNNLGNRDKRALWPCIARLSPDTLDGVLALTKKVSFKDIRFSSGGHVVQLSLTF